MAACRTLLSPDEYRHYHLCSFLGSVGTSHGYCISSFPLGFPAHRLMQNASPRSEGLGGRILHTDWHAHLVPHFESTLSKKEYFMPMKNYRITVSLPADLT